MRVAAIVTAGGYVAAAVAWFGLDRWVRRQGVGAAAGCDGG